MKDFITVFWPLLFSMGTAGMQALVDPSACVWPPKLDFSGQQLALVVKSPVWLCTAVPAILGALVLQAIGKSRGFSVADRAYLVWWHVNLFWFHIGCDILSGHFQVMPVLTELYTLMSPAHAHPRWHPERQHFDCAYGLELYVEVPFAAWLVYLFMTQDHRRYLVELVGLTVQFAGTVVYYLPGLMRGEHECWLSYADKFCGSFWIAFPAYVFIRTLKNARNDANGKKQKQK